MTSTRKPPPPGLDPTPLLALYPGRDDGHIAEQLDVSAGAVRKWRTGIRRIRRTSAYDLADAAGVHPWELWPELRDAALADVERTCARDGCDTRFVPYRQHRHDYCSPACAEQAARERRTPRRACDGPDCGLTFQPTRRSQRYCSKSCSRRAARQRRTPEQRRRDAAAVAAWKAANAEQAEAYNREYQRTWMRNRRRMAARSAA